MAYNARTMSRRSAEILEYGAFQQPSSPLFRDYLSGSASAAPFYEGGGWNPDTLVARETGEREASQIHARVATALARQQRERGAEEAAKAAESLAQPGAIAVVTGQQPVLFGGPLYVLYKALAAIRVAQRLRERRETGPPVVPVFWVASDDHDFAELRSIGVLDEAGALHAVRYEPSDEPLGRPAHAIALDETLEGLLASLAGLLPAGAHRDEVMSLLARCYRPGRSLSSAFAELLSALLPGLVVLDPSDPEIKELAVPVLRRELLESSPTSRLAAEVGRQLLGAGYHQQVPVRPGFLNLFVVLEERRRALSFDDGTVEIRGLGRTLPVDEAARMLDRSPGDWSPGVLLRPLTQDALLPTAAYVGGPAEIAYHAQIGPAYQHFGLRRPILVPRPSLTLVEPAQSRALEAERLSLPELQEDPEAIAARWARESYPDVEQAFAGAREALTREMETVERTLGALDPTLVAAAASARGRALHQIGTLHDKSVRALKKRDQVRTDRLRRTRDALLPGGAFQERGLAVVSLLARQGLAVIDEVRERMDPWARGHQVIAL